MNRVTDGTNVHNCSSFLASRPSPDFMYQVQEVLDFVIFILTFLLDFTDREWLQFDLGPPTTITGLVTRGQGDRKRYVTSYGMSYSNDSVNWYQYKDSNHIDSKTFGGNMDKATERRHYLNNPVTARYIR